MSAPERRPIADIKIGQRHRKDYGDLQELADSIRDQGLLQPIGITSDNELVFGERRLLACRDVLRATEIEVRVVNVTSIAEGEYAENQIRKDFTPSERIAIWDAVKVAIGNRSGQRNDLVKNKESSDGQPPADRPEVQSGAETREIAAQRAGFKSTTVARRVAAVVNNADQSVVEAMDKEEISIDAAHTIATKIPKEEQKAVVELPKPERAARVRAARSPAKPAKESPPPAQAKPNPSSPAPTPGLTTQSSRQEPKLNKPPTQSYAAGAAEAKPVTRPDANLDLWRFVLARFSNPSLIKEEDLKRLHELVLNTYSEVQQIAFGKALDELSIVTNVKTYH